MNQPPTPGHAHQHSDDHAHDHAHDPQSHHEHDALVIEDDAGNLEGQQRVAALLQLLTEKGLVSAAEVTLEIQKLEAPGTHLGARLVARAWVDDAFRAQLLADGKAAAAALGLRMSEAQLIVVDNTPAMHHVIVCTLCSCYPRSLLGQPPSWYISKAYRARTVREPARVLAEFGLSLPPQTALCVHDSTADMRFLVLPMRPPGTEGWSEEALQRLVTRDSMIGVAQALTPDMVAAKDAETGVRTGAGSGMSTDAATGAGSGLPT